MQWHCPMPNGIYKTRKPNTAIRWLEVVADVSHANNKQHCIDSFHWKSFIQLTHFWHHRTQVFVQTCQVFGRIWQNSLMRNPTKIQTNAPPFDLLLALYGKIYFFVGYVNDVFSQKEDGLIPRTQSIRIVSYMHLFTSRPLLLVSTLGVFYNSDLVLWLWIGIGNLRSRMKARHMVVRLFILSPRRTRKIYLPRFFETRTHIL